MKILYTTLLFALFLILSPPEIAAQLSATGFVRNYNAVLTRPDHEIITGRNRLRLDLKKGFSKGEIQISNDIRNLYSAAADSIEYRLREAYVDLYFKNSDLRLGKQIISWGRAEGAFITDILTPVDVSEFLTQDFADLRMGVTAMKYTRYFGSDYLQLVVNPVFNPNEIPSFDSRWFPRLPFASSIPVEISKQNPSADLKNIQAAARFSFRSNLNYDLDLGLMYWHNPTPSYFKELTFALPAGAELNLSERYAQSLIGIYSGSVRLSDRLLLTSESAYYHNHHVDYLPQNLRSLNLQNPGFAELLQIAQVFGQNEDGFLKERPWLISMIGLQYNVWDITFNGQFINEHIFNYDPTILQDQDYAYTTLSLRRSFARDTFRALLFSRYNINGQDFWVNPELTYTGIDSFEAALGAQLFGGRSPGNFYGHLSFDTYAANSFAYLKISAYF